MDYPIESLCPSHLHVVNIRQGVLIEGYAQQTNQGYLNPETLESTSPTVNHVHYSLMICIITATLYCAWWAWVFIISPALHPNEPRKLPYWIPMIGNAVGFFLDYHGALTHGRHYFGHTEEPYFVTMPGRNLCLISSPRQISAIYKNTAELTYDTFIRDTLKSIGASYSAVDKWIPSRLSKAGALPAEEHYNLIPGDFTHIGEKLCQRQLLPGNELNIVQKIFMDGIIESLAWEKITDRVTNGSISPIKSTSLRGWCQDVLIGSATNAFFGARLLQIDPNLIADFLIFDHSSWKLHFEYPRLLSHDMHSAKDRIVKAMTTYFELDKGERSDASFLIRNLEAEMEGMGIGKRDIAALLMPIYWVINANAYKQCFWLMCNILNNPAVLSVLREEVIPIVSVSRENLESRLEQQCPRLKAVYQETLRLTVSSSTIRAVQRTTQIGEKIIRAGTTILIPYRLLHLNAEEFGEDAQTFNAERFLKSPELIKNPHFRPFGGGKTYCPGRFLAQREVLTFVAMALYQFEIDIAGVKHGGGPPAEGVTSTMPRMDLKKFSLAVIDPMKDDDLIVDVRQREEGELLA